MPHILKHSHDQHDPGQQITAAQNQSESRIFASARPQEASAARPRSDFGGPMELHLRGVENVVDYAGAGHIKQSRSSNPEQGFSSWKDVARV